MVQVHHIDGKGQDSGVVYSEMQGRQNTAADLLTLR
jgi:Zn-dependent M16 (insulinase) family peptidase